mgnify:FL=1|jgi:hypothetical protein
MTFLVFCAFELKKASSSDYNNAYSDLESIGLSKVHVSGQGLKVTLPTISVMGRFEGVDSAAVRDEVRTKIKGLFAQRRFKSDIFITVGADWAWGVTTT